MDATAVAQGQMSVLYQHSVPGWDWLPGAPTAVAEVCAALAAR